MFFRPAYTAQCVWSEFSASVDDSRIRPNNTDVPSDFRPTVLWLKHDDIDVRADKCLWKASVRTDCHFSIWAVLYADYLCVWWWS